MREEPRWNPVRPATEDLNTIDADGEAVVITRIDLD